MFLTFPSTSWWLLSVHYVLVSSSEQLLRAKLCQAWTSDDAVERRPLDVFRDREDKNNLSLTIQMVPLPEANRTVKDYVPLSPSMLAEFRKDSTLKRLEETIEPEEAIQPKGGLLGFQKYSDYNSYVDMNVELGEEVTHVLQPSNFIRSKLELLDYPNYHSNNAMQLFPQQANRGPRPSSRVYPQHLVQPPTTFNAWPAGTSESLFAAGDIPQQWNYLVASTPLQAFAGNWQVLVSRSDSMETILTVLGIRSYKRKAMSNYPAVTTIEIDPYGRTATMHNYLPAGVVVGTSVPLDGNAFTYSEKETGVWTSYATFTGGRIGQKRESSKGTMYDVRAVFNHDPQGLYNGRERLMLFRWTFIPTTSSNKFQVDRWLRFLED